MIFEVVNGFYSCVFFFKQKTAYEVRISDWSSDVCSSDLVQPGDRRAGQGPSGARDRCAGRDHGPRRRRRRYPLSPAQPAQGSGGVGDRKSVVSGKSVSVRVDLGGRRILQKKKIMNIEVSSSSIYSM